MFAQLQCATYTTATCLGVLAVAPFLWALPYLGASEAQVRKFYSGWMWALARMLFGVRTVGAREARPCVYIMNHHSTLDFMLPATVLGGNAYEVVDANLFDRFPGTIGFALRRIGCVVARNIRNGARVPGDRESVVDSGLRMLASGRSLVVFPEGRRVGGLGEFRTGGYEMARRAGCPIQNVACINSRDYFPFAPGGAPHVVPQHAPLTFIFGPSALATGTDEAAAAASRTWFEAKLAPHARMA